MKNIFLVISFCVLVFSSYATRYKVSSLADDGSAGTLRSVIEVVKSGEAYGEDTIFFTVAGEVKLKSPIVIDFYVTIEGLGVDKTIIDGTNAGGSCFQFTGGFQPAMPEGNKPLSMGGVELENLTIQNSNSPDNGGACIVDTYGIGFYNVLFKSNKAVNNGGALFLTQNSGGILIKNCVFEGNEAGVDGGAIAVDKFVYFDLISTSFVLNKAVNNGGALFLGEYAAIYGADSLIFKGNEAKNGGALFLDVSTSLSGSAIVFDSNRANIGTGGAISAGLGAYGFDFSNSSFINNYAEAGGGAIYFDDASQGMAFPSFNQVTFSGNRTPKIGGALYFPSASLSINFCTITENTASVGGGVYLGGGDLSFQGTVIAGNTATNVIDQDLVVSQAYVNSNGYNFVGIFEGEIFISEGGNEDFVGTSTLVLQPKLLPLANNGGFSYTHEPGVGSPLLDVVPQLVVEENIGIYDQRGEPYKRFFGKNADIGAVEYQCDYVVDRTDDVNECGTLRHAINFANTNPGPEFISFDLPAGSTIELNSALVISDTLVLEGISVNRATGDQVFDKIGIKPAGTIQNGFVFNGTSGGSVVANFNFQGFSNTAIYLNGVSGVSIFSNSFGSILTDDLKQGVPNGNAIFIEKGSNNKIGVAPTGNLPLPPVADNYFIGNKVGVNNTAATTNTTITKNVFTCNTTAGIISSYKVPVIDSLYSSYMAGAAQVGDIVQVFVDTTCGKNQGVEFVGSYITDASGRWSTYGDFNPKFTYTAIATSKSGFSSSFSLPVSVKSCPVFESGLPNQFACGDSVSVSVVLKAPIGYELAYFDQMESNVRVNYSNDVLEIVGLEEDTTIILTGIYNSYCSSYDTVQVYRFDKPSEASILPFETTLCTGSTIVNAVSPTVGTGQWSSDNASITFGNNTDAITQLVLPQAPSGGYIIWSVSNGTCPLEKDSVMVNRKVSLTPEVTLAQLNTPLCSNDTIRFEAITNLSAGTGDLIEWFVNDQPVLSGIAMLYESNKLENGDVLKVVYASSLNACLTQESDTAELIISILQQKLTTVDDVFEVTTGKSELLDVLLNDTLQNESISLLQTQSPQAVVSGISSVEYTSFGKGLETFEYIVTGSCGSVDTAIVTVNVINTPPQGVDKEFVVLSGGTVSVTIPELFTDLEDNIDIFSGVVVSQTNASVSYEFMSEQLTIDYSSVPSYFGVDTLEVQVTDEAGDIGFVTIVVTVQDKLTANAGPDQSIDAYTTTLAATPVSGYITYWTALTTGISFTDSSSATTSVSGFDPAKSPYTLVWTVSNGVSVATDTITIVVKNVAPVVKPLVTVNIQITENTKTLFVEDLVVDKNKNLIGSIEIVKQFSFLPSSVIDINLEALTITVDLSKSEMDINQGVEDSLLYRICDKSGDCSESYIKIVRKGNFETVKDLGLSVGNVYNFMSPSGDNINESFFFNIDFGDVKWRFVDESSADGTLRRGDAFSDIFSSIIESAEVKIFNRWGDMVAEYDDYMGGKAYKSLGSAAVGTEIEDEYVWRGKDKKGEYVTPGTYYYYIILHEIGGNEVKENGFIEVRN